MAHTQLSLAALRADYDRLAGRSLSLPIAGALAWSVFGLAALFLDQRPATLLILFGSGAIFPLGLAIAKLRGENLLSGANPLARLMGVSSLMVNLLWALHLTLLQADYAYLPLSLGIGLGLHWIVFGWIINHPLGLIHACVRTALVTGLWWAAPSNRIEAAALGVVIAYLYAIYALSTRTLNSESEPGATV